MRCQPARDLIDQPPFCGFFRENRISHDIPRHFEGTKGGLRGDFQGTKEGQTGDKKGTNRGRQIRISVIQCFCRSGKPCAAQSENLCYQNKIRHKPPSGREGDREAVEGERETMMSVQIISPRTLPQSPRRQLPPGGSQGLLRHSHKISVSKTKAERQKNSKQLLTSYLLFLPFRRLDNPCGSLYNIIMKKRREKDQ